MDAPILYVIAGPNGIGKTTSDFAFVPGNIPVINSDEIAAEISRGEVLHTVPKMPDWVSQYLGPKFTKEIKTKTKARDLNSIEEVRKRYLENNKPRF